MIPKYVTDFFEAHLSLLDLCGNRVLEVGCGYAQLMGLVLDNEPGIHELVGINYPDILVTSPAADTRVLVMDASKMDFDDSSFGVCYSLATFEHIHDFAGTLSEIHRVLKPGGLMIAKWSPIWNGFDGHHYGPTLSDPSHSEIGLPWAHLIFDRESLPAYLEHGEGFSPAEAASATRAIYDSDWLSRRTVNEYEKDIRASGFEVDRLEATPCELGGLMNKIAAKITAGSIDPERVIRFFQHHDEHSLLSYKMLAYLRKPSSQGFGIARGVGSCSDK